MSTILAGLLMVGGTAFMLVAAIGLLRLPDLYTRMHAVTKAGTLGVGLILLSAAVAFGDVSVATRSLVALLFVLLTAPVSAHMIGRAGYLGKVEMWEGTVFDDWGGDYETLRREGEGDAPASSSDVQASAP
ncbi:MAG TPA: monovalent cation/H(+) antiporter subunit G [Salinibacter sp.]|nr:monovalent cation/H(+) antiporter subunit G [Salinibacter sp.]